MISEIPNGEPVVFRKDVGARDSEFLTATTFGRTLRWPIRIQASFENKKKTSIGDHQSTPTYSRVPLVNTEHKVLRVSETSLNRTNDDD